MMDQNCAYCMEGELSAKFGIKICELETSKVYLFKEQSHKGRVIVAHKKHAGKFFFPRFMRLNPKLLFNSSNQLLVFFFL